MNSDIPVIKILTFYLFSFIKTDRVIINISDIGFAINDDGTILFYDIGTKSNQTYFNEEDTIKFFEKIEFWLITPNSGSEKNEHFKEFKKKLSDAKYWKDIDIKYFMRSFQDNLKIEKGISGNFVIDEKRQYKKMHFSVEMTNKTFEIFLNDIYYEEKDEYLINWLYLIEGKDEICIHGVNVPNLKKIFRKIKEKLDSKPQQPHESSQKIETPVAANESNLNDNKKWNIALVIVIVALTIIVWFAVRKYQMDRINKYKKKRKKYFFCLIIH